MQLLIKIKDIRTCEVREMSISNGPDSDEFNRYIWSDGNYSCACNRHLFFERAIGNEPDDDDVKCGSMWYQISVNIGDEEVFTDYDDWSLEEAIEGIEKFGMQQKMTLAEFLSTPNTYPLTEGRPCVGPTCRCLPPWIILTDVKQ
ncbi:hypothetical protein KAU11_09605 [Candidatus Babeliales bacterium]|nr:hypothetical protein [Candidatus Babeliales bacterium]